MKTIVFDTGPIISLTMNNLLWILAPLKNQASVRFLITDLVKQELVDNPLNKTKRFMFEAMQVMECIESGILEVEQPNQRKTGELLELANSCFSAYNHTMKLVHPAEMSALQLCIGQGADALVVDERTTRLMIEDQKKLYNVLRHNYHYKINQNKSELLRFKKLTRGVRIIRSVELVTIAFEKGLLDRFISHIPEARKLLLEAVIWGVKLEGASVSKKELEQIMRIELKQKRGK